MASWSKLNQPIRTSKYTPNNHNIKTIYLVVLSYTADFDMDQIISKYSSVLLISILILLQHKGNLCWRSVCDIWIDLPCIYYLVLCTFTVIHRTSGVSSGVWHRDTGSRFFGSCGLHCGTKIDL